MESSYSDRVRKYQLELVKLYTNGLSGELDSHDFM